MPYSWVLFRDRLIIDEAFAAELSEEVRFYQIPKKTTLLLAAREVELAHGYQLQLSDFNLHILADTFDGSGELIDMTGAPGPDGSNGSNGADGGTGAIAGGNGSNGYPGGHGGNGSTATDFTLLCRRLHNLRVRANGTDGGQGGDGGTGGRGGPARPPVTAGRPLGPGGNGGNGGNAGRGGSGGSGGHIVLSCVEDMVPGGFDVGSSTSVNAGKGKAAGDPGIAGRGGPGDPDGRDGAEGQAARDGADGQAGTVTYDLVTETDHWVRTRALAGQSAQEWAAFRVRAGEYFLRLFRVDRPQYLDLALGEFNAALGLDPGNIRALSRRSMVLAHQNIYGLARNLDVIPVFREYESVIADYSPMIQGLADTALRMLPQGDLEEKRQDLSREITRLQGALRTLEYERRAAIAGVEAAGAAKARVETRILAARLEMANREAELRGTNIAFRIPGTDIPVHEAELRNLKMFADLVVALIAAVASYAAVPGLVSAAAQAVSEGAALDGQKGAEGRAKLERLAGGLRDAANRTKDVYSQAKMWADIGSTDADTKYKQLMQEWVGLIFDSAMARLRTEQESLSLRAVESHIAEAQADLAATRRQLDALTDNLRTRGQVARGLIAQAQRGIDTVGKYVFLAARALDIYTLSPVSELVSSDAGFLHPDDEDNAYLRLNRGDASRVEQLLRQYIISWGQLPSWVDLRDRYLQYVYFQELKPDLLFLSIKDPGQLDRFRALRELYVPVGLPDLPPNRCETKVESVFLALVGASSTAPWISCLVEHGGRSFNRKSNGDTVTLHLQPRVVPVQALMSGLQLSGTVSGGDASQLSFWGRSVACEWRIVIEPFEMARGDVDLSRLTEIQIAIGYKCLLL